MNRYSVLYALFLILAKSNDLWKAFLTK